MKDYIDKIEDIMQERRNNNPISKELDRLTNEIYPVKAIEGIYKLGYCSAIADLKNTVSKDFFKSDKETIDEWVKYQSKSEGYEILKELIR